MNPPDNWHNTTARPIGGPTVVIDLDGVISDAEHRQHFIVNKPRADRDWKGFFAELGDDPVIESGRRLADALGDVCVVILTARPHSTTEPTKVWLAANEVRHDWLILRGRRKGHNGVSTAEWKQSQLEALIEAGADIKFTVDDDPRNIEMMQALGLAAIYVPSGYYDRPLSESGG